MGEKSRVPDKSGCCLPFSIRRADKRAWWQQYRCMLCVGCVLRPQTKVSLCVRGRHIHMKVFTDETTQLPFRVSICLHKSQGHLTGSSSICIVRRVGGILVDLPTTPRWILSLSTSYRALCTDAPFSIWPLQEENWGRKKREKDFSSLLLIN